MSSAVMEMASASGIELIPADALDPMKATTFGTGELILDATLRLITAKGYAKTTMSDIATAANVGRGTVYWHFPSKDELFPERTSGLIFFENMMGIFFTGRDLTEEVLAETGSDIRVVVAEQQYDPQVVSDGVGGAIIA